MIIANLENKSTEKTPFSKKNYSSKYHSWQEIVATYNIVNKIKGYAFNSTRTDNQIMNELIKKDISKVSLNLLDALIRTQSFKTGQLNITNEGLIFYLRIKPKSIERNFTVLYKEIKGYIRVDHYWETPNRQRRQIYIDWDGLVENLPKMDEKAFKNSMKSRPPIKWGVTTNEVSCCSLSFLNSSSLNSGFKSSDKNSLNSKIFDKSKKEQSANQGINSFASLAINSSFPSKNNIEKEKVKEPARMNLEESEDKKPARVDLKEIEDDKILEIIVATPLSTPQIQSGDNVTTLVDDFFSDGNKIIKNKYVPKPISFELGCMKRDFEREEIKEEKYFEEEVTKKETNDWYKNVNKIEDLPIDLQEYLESLSEERRQKLIRSSNLIPSLISFDRSFNKPKFNIVKKETPLDKLKKDHYEKLERNHRVVIERREEFGKNKEQLREQRIKNIVGIYPNWQEILNRENCSLNELKYRMRKNRFYEPFTKDTSHWKFDCHPEYAHLNEEERDFKFIESVDIWLWPKPIRHSERNLKMFTRARIRADKLKITYYDWVAAIYDKIGELKIEYTHLNCSFAEELIEKWQDEGSNYPNNFGHMRRQRWLYEKQKNKKGGYFKRRKSVEEESEEIRDFIVDYGKRNIKEIDDG